MDTVEVVILIKRCNRDNFLERREAGKIKIHTKQGTDGYTIWLYR
jgi:hypothetical protein